MSQKLDHHKNIWYKNFQDLINFQHAHEGRIDLKRRKNKQLSYWVENQHKFYRQFLQDEHTPPTPYFKSSLENIGFFWTVENGSAGKGPISKKNKIPDDSKKVICAFLSFTMVSEAIPKTMIYWLPYFSRFQFTMEGQTHQGWRLFFVHVT